MATFVSLVHTYVKLKIAEGCLELFKLYEGVYKGAFLCCWE